MGGVATDGHDDNWQQILDIEGKLTMQLQILTIGFANQNILDRRSTKAEALILSLAPTAVYFYLKSLRFVDASSGHAMS